MNIGHERNMSRESELKTLLRQQVNAAGLPEPVEEYRGIPGRRFRFDLCFVDARIAVEIQGGRWIQNTGHNSGRGLERDYEKANLAMLSGWIYLQVSPEMVEDGRALTLVEDAFAKRKEAA